MDISFKNLLLAGIGTMAYSWEKAEELVNDLVKKGEITVSQGKELNEELKRKITEKRDRCAGDARELLKKAVSELDLASKQDIEELKKRLDELENR